ncbi:glycoside hydrolase family 38 C-terminal domain-containing protein [Pelagicoccus mobilis]|uniref:Glycoside hydrolase family 38 central domain-containing protein n=1 Tax=Pelagicoccus mobilis TaxID=415221 RepID=A0A934RVD1_9BACT|nr:glycoside hydrolase family 38 C-terminal domain-containing protein [Pelagicoccus mobilis]MBK1875506.1 hypothetical protein [Pelagicoccus mobilis]
MSSERKAIYILSTHWDREFYQTQEGFRYRLVSIIDDILDAFADGNLEGPFYSDGQSELWDQYLEIRPERAEQVRQLMADGSIESGPWYTMPDLFCVSGEALVRNLEYGITHTRKLGGSPSRVANVCDCFGHPGQMPQIYRGFDLLSATIWRGSNEPDHRNILWEAPDGTQIPVYRFGRNSYWGYGVHVRNVNKLDVPYTQERFADDLQNWINFEAERTATTQTLLFDGVDHGGFDLGNYEQLKAYLGNEYADHQIEHGSFDAYAEQLNTEADKIQKKLQGELRSPGYKEHGIDDQKVINSVISSRIHLKQLNAANDAALRHWAEPFTALETLSRQKPSPEGFLRVAWKNALIPHFHDSISGSVPRSSLGDNEYRLRQSTETAEELTNGSLHKIAANVSCDITPDASTARLLIFNSLPSRQNKVHALDIELPSTWSDSASPAPFRILSETGQELPYSIIEYAGRTPTFRTFKHKEPERGETDTTRIAIELDLPAIGYATYRIEKGAPTNQSTGGIASGNTLENDRLKVTLEADGTLTVIDKINGQTYRNLLVFHDEADKGHVYHCDIPQNSGPINSRNTLVSATVHHSTPHSGALELVYKLDLPNFWDRESEERSPETTPFEIHCIVSLKQGQDALDLQVDFNNTVQDHRLRLLCPTGTQTDTYLTDGAFDAVERTTAPIPRLDDLCEPWQGDAPLWNWIAAQDKQRGIALCSSGLHEGKLFDDEQRTLALTLLRSARNFFWEYHLENDYDQGEYSQNIRIQFLDGCTSPAELSQIGQEVAAPPRSITCTELDHTRWHTSATLPSNSSLLEIDGPVVLTSCRRLDNDLEIRLFNPSPMPEDYRLTFSTKLNLKAYQFTNLAGTPEGDSNKLGDNSLSANLAPKKITTIRLAT